MSDPELDEVTEKLLAVEARLERYRIALHDENAMKEWAKKTATVALKWLAAIAPELIPAVLAPYIDDVKEALK